MLSNLKLINSSLTVLLFLSSIAFANGNVLNKTLSLKASKEQVWSALTSENELSQWWNDGVKLEPVVGGDFYEPWGDDQLATGKVKRVITNKLIEFTWQEKYWDQSQITTCLFTIKAQGDHSILEVQHSGWNTFKDIEEKEKMIIGFEKGWDAVLSRLRDYIEDN